MDGRRKSVDWRMIAHPHDHRHTLLPARPVLPSEGFIVVRRAGGEPFAIRQQDWDEAPVRGQ